MFTESTFHLRRTVKGAAISLPFEKIARSILGPRYELSLTICGDKLARKMNAEYRKKTYSPNVLSFPYGKSEGEIFLNVRKSARESKQFGISERERLAFLYVHACLHLKGFDHGEKMERLEKEHMKKFGF